MLLNINLFLYLSTLALSSVPAVKCGTYCSGTLTFSPDFRTSFDYYDGYWSQGSTFSVKPKVTCQRVEQGLITEECGQGAALSVNSQDESQMKTLSFTLGIDTISNDTTYSANALYKVEF